MVIRSQNALHCTQSTYNLNQIGKLANKIHDSTTRKFLCDKIVSRHVFTPNPNQNQVKAVNHALAKLGDTRRF